MEIFKFFNSAPGDARTYQAADFADYFGSVLSTGLLHTTEVPGMSVTVEAGTLNTVVNAGKAIMKGHLYENTAPLTLSHSIPEATLDRIDRIVLRLDLRNAERNIKLHVKQGVSSASPVAPALQRDNFIYELSLAQVRVRANTASLRVSDLLDERLDENLCGIVYSLISIPTDQFQLYITARTAELGVEAEQFEQQLIQNLADYEQEYQEWFADLKASGFASASEFAAHKADEAAHGIGDKALLSTTAKTSIVDAINEVFQSGNNVKRDMVAALLAVDPALPITENSSWEEIETAAAQISTGKKFAEGTFNTNNTISVNTLNFRPNKIWVTGEIGGATYQRHHQSGVPSAFNKTVIYSDFNTAYKGGEGAYFTITNTGFSCTNLGFASGMTNRRWEASE